jgi:hypothetical protein
MLTTPYAAELAGEMNRCLSTRYGWTATLFQHSTTNLLEELLVAGSQVSNGVLSSSSFDDLIIQVKRQFFKDPGLGDDTARVVLGAVLPKNSDEFSNSSHKYRVLKSEMPRIGTAYLDNWKSELCNPDYSSNNIPGSLVSPAEAGSYLAAFLFGLGMNSDYLVKWLDYRLSPNTPPIDLGKIPGSAYRPIH